MSPKASVYTQLQIFIPFSDAPWKDVSDSINQQNLTFGHGNNSVGGIYVFDNVENAQNFATGYMNSPYYYGQVAKNL